ncbi:MAG TPA: HlyD family type I secretion periplasmic adaptor subunit, partial [Rhabdaerophilum sp.]|nr:HlyD family type I secretion periplasmic adaptor subunit [Rhabdaerophilum sp.]
MQPGETPRTASPLPTVPSTVGHIRLGIWVGLGAFFAIVGWLAVAELTGAIVAQGLVVVEGEPKKVQHQIGGVVGELLVKEGGHVAADQVMIRLDMTIPRSQLAQIETQLAQLVGRRARLEAERDGRDAVVFPVGFAAGSEEERQVAARERLYLHESRETRRQQAEQLIERIGQYEREVEGTGAQIAAKSKEIELIAVELSGVEVLFRQNLIPISRITALQREVARLGGEKGSLEASVAKARGQIAEIRIQLLSLEQRVKADAVKELGEVEASIAQLVERKVAAEDQLRRIDIRAVQSGFVHQLRAHHVGAVIAPGETVMLIVPDQERLVAEFRVSPTEIDQIRLGQPARLRFSAFNSRTTPEIGARVIRVAPDITRDSANGAMYFVVRAGVEQAELARLGGHAISP